MQVFFIKNFKLFVCIFYKKNYFFKNVFISVAYDLRISIFFSLKLYFFMKKMCFLKLTHKQPKIVQGKFQKIFL